MLSTPHPAHSVRGGIYDSLRETTGTVLAISHEEAADASARFAALEGIDLEPASAVAAASIVRLAAQQGQCDSIMLLHVTGGGLRSLTRTGLPVPAIHLYRCDGSARDSDQLRARLRW